ncbi:MAG TPA: hypothetical protein H9982_06715 [Candidatus Barnesiella excrementipullorum]|uniref:Calx-beta domain-containing protein n=1 Tax=Candidatus Barnesiella excrementipullorum TaxID=2838479 RepID=A0A9D1VSL1_9BACT|nr:hypothetical protein [Candidatus Barnesiella excrementipullorum]
MKVKSLLYTSLAASLLFASCNLNEQPVFDDATQAFIAFSATSGNVFEAVDGVPDTLKIELYCASVAGISASVQVVPTDTAYPESQRAKEGVDFKIEGESEIHFDADNRFATIKIVSIDNNVQGGNKRFDLVLTSPQGCNLGANKRFTVSILDDEDPVNMLIGNYTATAESAFQGSPAETWSATIERDFESEDVVYIQPICEFGGLPGSSVTAVAATVDAASNTIHVQLGQPLYGTDMVLADLNGNTSGNLIADLYIEGTSVRFVFRSGYGVPVPDQAGYWYQALQPATFVKQ